MSDDDGVAACRTIYSDAKKDRDDAFPAEYKIGVLDGAGNVIAVLRGCVDESKGTVTVEVPLVGASLSLGVSSLVERVPVPNDAVVVEVTCFTGEKLAFREGVLEGIRRTVRALYGLVGERVLTKVLGEE